MFGLQGSRKDDPRKITKKVINSNVEYHFAELISALVDCDLSAIAELIMQARKKFEEADDEQTREGS